MTNPKKFHIFLRKICQDLAGKYMAQVSFARWRSSDKQLGPRTVNLLLIPATQKKILHKNPCVYKPLLIDLYTGLARKIKAILFSKHRRGYTDTYMASAQSVEL